MGKKIRHMDMTMTKTEHERWHQEPSELAPAKHDAFMKRLGISKKEDEEWHRRHRILADPKLKGLKPVNPFAIGGGFLNWCISQGWLVLQGKQYFATKEGVGELRKYFGIEI